MLEPLSEKQVMHRGDQVTSLAELVVGEHYRPFSVDSNGAEAEQIVFKITELHGSEGFFAEARLTKTGKNFDVFFPFYAFGITPRPDGKYVTTRFIVPIPKG